MPTEPITRTALGLDLSSRVVTSSTVVASPAAAAETIVASITVTANIAAVAGVLLMGWAAYTVGTSGTAVQLRVRQTNVAGTLVGASGALTGSQHGAAIVSADDINAF